MSRIKKLLLFLITFYSAFSSAVFLDENQFVDHELVSKTLIDPSNRYYNVLSKVAPLVLRKIEGGGSATVFAKSNDGQGLVLTALHIESSKFFNSPEILGLQDLADWSFELQPIRREDKSPVKSVIDYLKDKEYLIPVLGGFTLYKPNAKLPNTQANISWYPKTDFALITLPQVDAWYFDVPTDPSMGTLPAMFPGKYFPEPLTSVQLDSIKIANPKEGAEVILVGFPRKNEIVPSTQNRLELRNGQSYSTGKILSDRDAEELLKTAEGEERLLPYNKQVEFLVLGSATVGFSGGGAFDINGNYLGILIRSGKFKDGRQFVRIIRSQYAITQSLQRLKKIINPKLRNQSLQLIPNEVSQFSQKKRCMFYYH